MIQFNQRIDELNKNSKKQVVETATGIKPAPPYTNLTIGYMEIKLFYKLNAKFGSKIANYFWDVYRRFLDDGQIMWDVRLGNFLDVLEVMNTLDPMIKFTFESSKEKLIFLDIVITKTHKGFETEVYQKETDAAAYLPFKSCHPRHTKINVPFNLARRVRCLTDNDNICDEKMQILVENLITAGYPKGLVTTAAKKARNTDKNSLRELKSREDSEKILAFVMTHDPSLPQIAWDVRNLISRIYHSKELKPIFKDYKIVNSKREPLNLLRILQHSRFDEFPEVNQRRDIVKCGQPNCKCCKEILEVDELYFPTSEIRFKIQTKMDCTVRNVIYTLICKKCEHTY